MGNLSDADLQLLVAVIALGGVLIGAVLTFLLGLLSQHLRDRREDRVRWHQARLDAYAEFVTKAAGVANHASRFPDVPSEQAELGRELVEQGRVLTAEMKHALAVVRLLGRSDVVAAADEVQTSLTDLMILFRSWVVEGRERGGDSPLPETELDAGYASLSSAIDRFHVTARRELHRKRDA